MVCSLAAAVVLIGMALFTSGCAVSDDYYGGGVYDYGWGDPFYGGYYGGGYYGGYYSGVGVTQDDLATIRAGRTRRIPSAA